MSIYTINMSVSTNEDWVDVLQFQEGPDGEQTPVDLAGSSFLMHMRTGPTRLEEALILSTANGRLIIEPAPEDVGKLTIFVPQAIVDDLEPGAYVFDIVWTMADGRHVNLASGNITINLGITR